MDELAWSKMTPWHKVDFFFFFHQLDVSTVRVHHNVSTSVSLLQHRNNLLRDLNVITFDCSAESTVRLCCSSVNTALACINEPSGFRVGSSRARISPRGSWFELQILTIISEHSWILYVRKPLPPLRVNLHLWIFSPAGAPCYSKPPSLLGPYPRNPPFDYPWGFNPYLPGAFSLNNCPKLPPGSLYPSQFYPNPLQSSLSQLPHPFSSLLPPGEAGGGERGQTGGTNGTAGGQPARLCLPPYPGSLMMGRTEIVNGATLGERERAEANPPGTGLSLGAVSLGAGTGTGQQSPSERRGGVKQDPESDSDLEITDLSDCSSENENEHEFGIGKGSGLVTRPPLVLDGKKGSMLPPISSLPPPVSPHPLKSLMPITPPPPSLPPSLSPSTPLHDRHREAETLKMIHS